jgi:hypothetical protein
VVPYKVSVKRVYVLVYNTYIFVAVHAQALYLVNYFRAIFAVLLCACLRNPAAHVLEKVLCQTWLRHVGCFEQAIIVRGFALRGGGVW